MHQNSGEKDGARVTPGWVFTKHRVGSNCFSLRYMNLRGDVQLMVKLYIHPRKLTWNLKNSPWKTKIIFQTFTLGFHVNFREPKWPFLLFGVFALFCVGVDLPKIEVEVGTLGALGVQFGPPFSHWNLYSRGNLQPMDIICNMMPSQKNGSWWPCHTYIPLKKKTTTTHFSKLLRMVHPLSNKKRVHTQIATSDCGSPFRLPAVNTRSLRVEATVLLARWHLLAVYSAKPWEVPHYKVGPEPIATNENSWGPYKWPKIRGFHWGEFTLLAHLVDLEQTKNPPVIYSEYRTHDHLSHQLVRLILPDPCDGLAPKNAEPPSEHF